MGNDRPYEGFLWPIGIYDIPSRIPAAPKEEAGPEVPPNPEGRGPVGITFYVDGQGEFVGHEVFDPSRESKQEQEVPVDLLRWGDDGGAIPDDSGGNNDLEFVS